jgi:hypothetical protein
MEQKKQSHNSDKSLPLDESGLEGCVPESSVLTPAERVAEIRAVMRESQLLLSLPWMQEKLKRRWEAMERWTGEDFTL